MSNEQIVAEYIGNASMEQVQTLEQLVRDRRKALLALAAAANTLNLTPGSRARLANVSPKYLNGQYVTVTGRKGAKFQVELEDGATGRFGSKLNVPASCLAPI